MYSDALCTKTFTVQCHLDYIRVISSTCIAQRGKFIDIYTQTNHTFNPVKVYQKIEIIMSLKEQIDQDIKQAMRERKKEELTALRAIKSMILLAETEKGAGGNLSEENELKLLTKAAKQRKESADIYLRENRAELAEKEEFEYSVISRYLPAQLSDDELSGELDKIIQDSGATSPRDMGKVMGLASKSLAGKADGKKIAALVKEKLMT
jgi:uncharacterized protein YqeY